MNQQSQHLLHLVLIFAMGISGAVNWWVYRKYLQVYGPEVSATEQIRRLIRAGNPHGWYAMIGSAVCIVAGLGIVVLNFYR